MLQLRHQQLTPCSSASRLQHHHPGCHHSRVCVRANHAACRAAPKPVPAFSRPPLTQAGPSGSCGTAAAATSHPSTTPCSRSRATGVVCRDAPRPMWAKQPDESPQGSGGGVARMITRDIARCNSAAELSDIYNEWGGSFDFIHAAAALVKCGKLPGGSKGGSKADLKSRLVDKLCSTWLNQLPLSGRQGCANVLWACVRLGPGAVQRLWGPTWEAYIALVQQGSAVEGEVDPQHISSPLWACAKLRKQPSVDELQLLVQAFLQPDVLTKASPQALANVIWAVGDLHQGRAWEGGVSEQDVLQLLGKQQLQVLAADGNGQNVSSVLLSLARMAEGEAPLLSVAFACDCSKQLLALTEQQTASWNSQHFTNALWACGQLGIADTPFIAAAVAAAPRWAPTCNGSEVRQAMLACATLNLKHKAFLTALLDRGHALLQQDQQQRRRRHKQSRAVNTASAAADRAATAAMCSWVVAQLDLPVFAAAAKSLLASSGVGQYPDTHPSNLRRLWVFNSWLVQHQLLDGKGLAGVLTEQQLQQGAKEAEVWS